VVRLLAEGRSNREIGDRLYIAESTASVHVSRILRKLGVRTRAEVIPLVLTPGVLDEG
jgi:DNA-binding NarL/FixJ family response regulator